jgi:hypothetical protein
MARGDDAIRIGNDRAVVEEYVDVILGRKQCADVAVEYEVGLHPPLNGLSHFRVDGVDEIANLLADLLLPRR